MHRIIKDRHFSTDNLVDNETAAAGLGQPPVPLLLESRDGATTATSGDGQNFFVII